MADGPLIASVAALIGDPARANMLTALMNGRALTARELAETGGIAPPTASGHLARLVDAGLLAVRRQGRHRYYRLSGPDVAETLEALMGLAQRTGAVPVRTGPRDAALREARLCYDHLAGERGVALLESLRRRNMVDAGRRAPADRRGPRVSRRSRHRAGRARRAAAGRCRAPASTGARGDRIWAARSARPCSS